jgi:hypothetical protein
MYCKVDAFLRSLGVAKARGGLDLPSQPPNEPQSVSQVAAQPTEPAIIDRPGHGSPIVCLSELVQP